MGFNLKQQVELRLWDLSQRYTSLKSVADGLSTLLDDYYDLIQDDDFPHKQNVYRFIQKYRSVFTERTLGLAAEVETLRKDWQLKAGTFNKEKGVWEYDS